MACLDIPTITEKLYKVYEKEVGLVIEQLAKKSCKKAIREEREQAILRAKELLNEL